MYPELGTCQRAALRPADFDEPAAKLDQDEMLAGSVCNCLVPVRSMLPDAVRLGLLPVNPAARVVSLLGRKPEQPPGRRRVDLLPAHESTG